jgi:lactate permease
MDLTLWNWLLAALPLLVVLVLMVGFRWGGVKAGPAGWLVALGVAVLRFGAGGEVLLNAQGRALLLTLDVLYVVWGALLFFQVIEQAGALRVIGRGLPRLTADPVMQALLLAWVFASFLQGVGGFGVPVAVVAPLLLSLGVSPLLAVVMPSLGHGWAVTFGSLGLSFQALISATGMTAGELAPWSAFLLSVMCIFSGVAVAHACGGWGAVRRGFPAILLVGGVMAVVLYVVVIAGLWSLGSTVAGLAGLAAAVWVARLPRYRNTHHPDGETGAPEANGISLWWALSGYAVLLLFTFGLKGVPQLKDFFSQVKLSVSFAQVQTSRGWMVSTGTGRQIPIFGHAGAILFYASALTFFMYRVRGFYAEGAGRRVLVGTARKAAKSSVGILALVSMALAMENAGMTNMLARGLSESVPAPIYPPLATLIGALGAFMTGSNTNSNVVFGALQMETASLLALSVPLILAVQTAAAAIGSVMAPTKLIVGASTGGMAGREGEVLRAVLGRGVALLVLLAGLALVFAQLAA